MHATFLPYLLYVNQNVHMFYLRGMLLYKMTGTTLSERNMTLSPIKD